MEYRYNMNTIFLEINRHNIIFFRKEQDLFVKKSELAAETDIACLLEQYSPAEVFCSARGTGFSFWNTLNTDHNPLHWHTTKTENGIVRHDFDFRLEILLSALNTQKIQERSFREGITFIFEREYNFFAVLLYKNMVYGAFEHCLQNLSPELLKKNLEEFRFGWLPHEEVLKQRGSGCILKNIPAEAEGFRPTFICCEHKELFAETGRFIQLENTKETAAQLLGSAQ